MQVHDLLLESARRSPDQNFCYDQGRWYGYREVEHLSRAVARALMDDAGINRGMRVALLWDNGIQSVAAFFGTLMAGAVVVPLNTEFSAESLAEIVRHSDAEALIVSAKLLRRIRPELSAIPAIRTVITDAVREPEGILIPWPGDTAAHGTNGPDVPVRTIDIDLAAIIYTSGSTGTPKGVMLSHLNLVSNMRSIAEYLHLSADDSVMVILPLFYIYGLSLLLTHALVGGTVVFDNRFMYPNTVLRHMVEREVTGFAGVPSTFSVLLSRSSLREMEFPKLRYITQAGGAMPAPTQQQVAEAFAPADLYIMYGATEAAPRLSYVEPADLPRKWGSIGKAVPNVDLYVADDTGSRLPTGAEGEIVARGSNLTAGYWKDPEGSAAVLRNGLYYTGDLGREDDEGFLYVTGRSKDIMKIKGYRVSPKEIEERLAHVDGVAEAAVVGIPDEILGEAPVAFVLWNGIDQPSEKALRKYLGEHLASYKIPTRILFPESFPRSGAGKVLKRELREQIIGGTDDTD